MGDSIRKLLVTGGTGFVGSALVAGLAREGYDLAVMVRPQSAADKVQKLSQSARIVVFDGSAESMKAALEAVAPDAVVHLAAFFTPEHRPQDVASMVGSNVLLGTLLLDAMKALGVQYFLNTGTHQQHFGGEDYNPVNLYAATKQAFETIARFYLETGDLRMVTLKLVDTYGPLDTRPKVMNLLKRLYRTGESLAMSPGEQEVGAVYIDDVVRAYHRALEVLPTLSRGEARSFVVAPPCSHTLKEIAACFEQIANRALNIEWGGRPYRDREMMLVWRGDPNILEGMGVTGLTEGIKRMVTAEVGKESYHGPDPGSAVRTPIPSILSEERGRGR